MLRPIALATAVSGTLDILFAVILTLTVRARTRQYAALRCLRARSPTPRSGDRPGRCWA